MTKNNYLTGKAERLSYGSWFVGQNIIYFMVVSYLAIFLTDEVGLFEGSVAALFLVARIWDAVNDPIIGSLLDKVNLKKGKYKPWVDAVTIFMPIITILLFWNFNGSSTFNLVYASVSYLIYDILYTISDVPIFALATVMTDNSDERVSIISIGRVAAGIASLIIGIIAPQLIAGLGYQSTIIYLMIIAFILMFPLRFFVKERVKYKTEENISLKEMIKAVGTNRYLLIFYIAYIAINATFTTMTIAPYFAKWNMGDIGFNTIMMITMALPIILLPALSPMLIRKFGKRKIFMWGIGSSIVFSVIQYFVGYENVIVFLILNFLKMIGLIAPMMMNGMFSADCVEYGAYKYGQRNAGMIFSVQTFSTKLGSAISSSLSLLIISYFGYQGTASVQTAEALNGIWITLSLVPIIGLVIAFIVFGKYYDLSESEVQRMIDEMEEKNLLKTE